MKNSINSRAIAFGKDTGGQISIIVALALIPILTIAGLAIDFQRTSTYKSRVQYAMDGALIAGSKAKQEGKSDEQIEALIKDYMNAVLIASDSNTVETYCEDVSVDIPQNSEDINATIDCSFPTTLSMAVGRRKMDFTVSSTSTYGIGNLDVAFVFDVSGSMGGSRISDLRSAAKTAVDTLLPEGANNSENGITRIAMTSYANMVDAGDYFTAATGLPQTREYVQTYTETEKVKTTCKKYKKNKKNKCKKWNYEYVDVEKEETYTITDTCVHERDGAHAFNDAPPGENETYTFNTAAYEDSDGSTVPSAQTTETDNSFLTERQPTWDENKKEWNSPTRSCSDHPPLALTDNKTVLKQYIDDLSPGGRTAGHQGTMWGWYLISPNWGDIWVEQAGESARPFDYDEPDTAKALIMMTDGSFNEVYHSDQGTSSQQAIATCATAKANGIVIYTVAFQAPDDAAATLEACATGPEYSHTPENSQELEDAYQAIATSISDLRIKF